MKRLGAASIVSASVWGAGLLPGIALQLPTSHELIPVVPEFSNLAWTLNTVFLAAAVFVLLSPRRSTMGRIRFTLTTFALATFPFVAVKAVIVAISVGLVEAINQVSTHILLQALFGVSPAILLAAFGASFAVTKLKFASLKPTFSS